MHYLLLKMYNGAMRKMLHKWKIALTIFFLLSTLIQCAPFVTVFIRMIIRLVPKLNYSTLLTAAQDPTADCLLNLVITLTHIK
jgi:hypothetical protein